MSRLFGIINIILAQQIEHSAKHEEIEGAISSWSTKLKNSVKRIKLINLIRIMLFYLLKKNRKYQFL